MERAYLHHTQSQGRKRSYTHSLHTLAYQPQFRHHRYTLKPNPDSRLLVRELRTIQWTCTHDERKAQIPGHRVARKNAV